MTYGSESKCATHYTTAPHKYITCTQIDRAVWETAVWNERRKVPSSRWQKTNENRAFLLYVSSINRPERKYFNSHSYIIVDSVSKCYTHTHTYTYTHAYSMRYIIYDSCIFSLWDMSQVRPLDGNIMRLSCDYELYIICHRPTHENELSMRYIVMASSFTQQIKE